MTYTGIDVLGDAPWGSHFCTFYDSPGDMLELMAAYFAAGLANDEACLWVLSSPFSKREALQALDDRTPNLKTCLENGQLLVLDYDEWYLTNGIFDIAPLLKRWETKYADVMSSNFNGLRANGVESWLHGSELEAFLEYERALDVMIRDKQVLVHCSFPLQQCNVGRFIDVATVHEKVVTKKDCCWHVLEIQEIKQSKAALAQRNERLESIVRERTKILEMTVKQLESEVAQRIQTESRLSKIARDLTTRNADLEQFSYILSHNLRGPITNISGISQLLTEASPDDEQGSLRQLLTLSIEELDSVVKDLGQIVRIRLGEENREPVCLNSIVETLRIALSRQIGEANAVIITDFSEVGSLYTVRVFLYSVFSNLISNSVKYRRKSKESPQTVIEVKSRLVGDNVRISFSDNGQGIDLRKYGHRVFKLYERFSKCREGRGLGLFLVRSQVEMLGGSIKVISRPGLGTRFNIDLPIHE